MTELPLAYVAVVFAGAAVGSYAIRASFVLLFGRVEEVPPSVERPLRLVPAAVLAGLVLPGLVVLDGSLALSPANDRLLAGLLAAGVAWRTESLLATVSVGMGALWALEFLL